MSNHRQYVIKSTDANGDVTYARVKYKKQGNVWLLQGKVAWSVIGGTVMEKTAAAAIIAQMTWPKGCKVTIEKA